MHSTRTAVLAVALAAGVSACQTAGRRTAVGAGAGAVVGAGAGALLGGRQVGAGVGALAGGSIGLYLDRQASELEQTRLAQVKRTDDGVLVKLASDILFESGSSALHPESIAALEQMGDILARYSDDRIKIMGFTDSVGGVGYNEELSLRRADAVKRILVGRGVRQGQITALGMGDAQPVAGNETPTGRKQNRRVELRIDVPKAT